MQILVQAFYFLEFARIDFKKEKLEIFSTRLLIVNNFGRKINGKMFFFIEETVTLRRAALSSSCKDVGHGRRKKNAD